MKPELHDIVGLLGVGLVAGGMYMIWKPGAALVPGGLCIVLAMLSYISRARRRTKAD